MGDTKQYSASVGNGTGPYSYSWGGTDMPVSVSAPNATYTFGEKGSFNITVQVTDANGATGNGNLTVNVQELEPLTASVTGPDSGSSGENYVFSANASGGKTPYTYTWDTHQLVSGQGEAAATYNFPGASTFTIECTVQDASGQSVQASKKITITAPIKITLYGLDNGSVNKDYSVSAYVQNAVLPFTYMWNYTQYIQNSDPEKSNNVDYIFPSPAVYTIRLTVRDATGRTGTGSKTITIAGPVTATIVGPSTTSPNIGTTYYVQVHGGRPPYYYFWYCDDGNGNNIIQSNRASQATIQFPKQKQYVVDVKVFDSTWYNYAEATKTVTVSNPISVVVLGPMQANAGDTFTYTAKVYGGAPPYTYEWTTSYDYWARIISGQGTSSVQVNFPHHIDDDVSIYCTVTDSRGNKSTGSIDVTNGYSPGPHPYPHHSYAP